MDGLVRVECPDQPNLWIPSIPVQFVDGFADVDAEALAELAPYVVHGVRLPVDSEPASLGAGAPDGEPAPKLAAKRTRAKPAASPFGN